jgi:hypothetical protein
MRLPDLGTVIAWPLLVGTVSSCSTHQKLGLAPHLGRMTGTTATNCGVYRIPPVLPHKLSADQAQAVSACISDAHAKREAFWFSVEGPGIDSYLATGLFGAGDGTVRRFWYDSAPCGGPQCDERFTTAPCAPENTLALDPEMKCAPLK